MDDGLYEVRAEASGRTVAGMVIVADGRFHGGGGGYVFRGRLPEEGNAGVAEVVKLEHAPAVLGLFKQVTVPVFGTCEREAFSLQGRTSGHHIITIRLEGVRLTGPT